MTLCGQFLQCSAGRRKRSTPHGPQAFHTLPPLCGQRPHQHVESGLSLTNSAPAQSLHSGSQGRAIMRCTAALKLIAVLVLSGGPCALAAQDTGALSPVLRDYGGRGLGNAIGSAITRAANAIPQEANGAGPAQPLIHRPAPSPRKMVVTHFQSLPRGDALQGTAARTVAFSDGRTMRASGTFHAYAAHSQATCRLKFTTLYAGGGFQPSGPPHDGCLNFGV
jgi:hypothetical protein